MPVNPRVIAHPDVVLPVSLEPGMVKDFRPMFDKSVLDEGLAIDLRRWRMRDALTVAR